MKHLAARKNWILDVDDCLYDIDCGLHACIKNNIVRVFNDQAARDPALMRESGYKLVQPDDLGTAFPPIVKAVAKLYPAQLDDYLSRFYGDHYALVAPAPDLADAFRIADQKGINIWFYTNSPFVHVRKVMERLGFAAPEIDAMQPRAYDLLASIRAGRGKPTAESMADFLKFSGIDPATALMADDGVKNLLTAHAAGIAPLWTWTSDNLPDAPDRFPRVRDTAAALKAIALYH